MMANVDTQLIVTLLGMGAVGGLLFGYRKDGKNGLVWPHRAEAHKWQLGCVADVVYGSAGAIAIFLVAPLDISTDTTKDFLRVLAMALVGGYGGPAMLDRALSATVDRLSRQTEEVSQKQQSLEGELQKRQEQQTADAATLKLVMQQCELRAPETPEADLAEALKTASDGTREIAFQRAVETRSTSWRTEKWLVTRTVPLFKALVDLEPNNHRYRGQYGYALKDQQEPDWHAALEQLQQAIALRDAEGQGQWFHYYELNRALCRIAIDSQGSPTGPSDPELRRQVLADLETASTESNISRISQESWVAAWLSRQGIDPVAIDGS